MKSAEPHPQTFQRIKPDGSSTTIERDIAEEVPIATEINGFGYAVLMATHDVIEDLVVGFALSDRLIERGTALPDIDIFKPIQAEFLSGLELPRPALIG